MLSTYSLPGTFIDLDVDLLVVFYADDSIVDRMRIEGPKHAIAVLVATKSV